MKAGKCVQVFEIEKGNKFEQAFNKYSDNVNGKIIPPK